MLLIVCILMSGIEPSVSILRLLRTGSLSGYQLARLLRGVRPEILSDGTGLIYPMLQHMECEKLISAAWKRPGRGRRCRCYSLTSKGRRLLARQADEPSR